MIESFRTEAGVPIQTTYDGTGRLTALINAGLPADIIVAADASFLDRLDDSAGYAKPEQLREQNARLIANTQSPIVVTWSDLLSGRCRLSLPLESTSAIGDALASQLDKSAWSELVAHAVVRRTTVTEVAADVAALDAADAGIVWDTTWPNDRRLKTIDAPPLKAVTGQVALARHSAIGPLADQLADQLATAIRSIA